LIEEQSGVVVFIPAFKKSSFFQDDLLRKLDGVALVQRAINKALSLGIERTAVHVLTDSEEVHLLATRSLLVHFLTQKVVGALRRSVKKAGRILTMRKVVNIAL